MEKAARKRRFQQSSEKQPPKIHCTLRRQKQSTKSQVKYAVSLLKELGLDRRDDAVNLRFLGRKRIYFLIESCLEMKRKRQAQGNGLSPLPNRGRDNARVIPGPSQGETPREVSGLQLQP